MEPEVHIIEKYFQLIKQCFTMTNIRLKGGKEIDLLAFNPRTGEKYHVEARVSTTSAFKLRLHDTKLKDGRVHRRGLDFFNKQKFNHPTVLKKIHELFHSEKYRKILVIWRARLPQINILNTDLSQNSMEASNRSISPSSPSLLFQPHTIS
jgi:hypothetical protein